jgi:hypothetical protein
MVISTHAGRDWAHRTTLGKAVLASPLLAPTCRLPLTICLTMTNRSKGAAREPADAGDNHHVAKREVLQHFEKLYRSLCAPTALQSLDFCAVGVGYGVKRSVRAPAPQLRPVSPDGSSARASCRVRRCSALRTRASHRSHSNQRWPITQQMRLGAPHAPAMQAHRA